MKIAILSDVHGNWPALHAVTMHVKAWQPDHVVVAGDSVNRGPSSRDCWNLLLAWQRSAGWQVMMGNHEVYVLNHTHAMSRWTWQQMNIQASSLATLPETVDLTGPDGSELRVRHASMRGHQDGIFPHSPVAEVRVQIAPAPAVFCTAHVHVPYTRQVDDTLVVNAGSVGSPCDGDTRASYAQVVWRGGRWQARIVRLAYDVAQTDRDFRTSGFLEQAGPLARLVYREWRTARSLVVPWRRQYEPQVAAGVIDEETAVAQFLAQLDG
jgi:predicted phosphodiesterase